MTIVFSLVIFGLVVTLSCKSMYRVLNHFKANDYIHAHERKKLNGLVYLHVGISHK